MRFQVFSKSTITEHQATGAPLQKPVEDAFFDEELNGWVVDIDDLQHLLTYASNCRILLWTDSDMPVLVLQDE